MEGIFPGVNDKHLPKRCLKARWRYDALGTIPREGCTAHEPKWTKKEKKDTFFLSYLYSFFLEAVHWVSFFPISFLFPIETVKHFLLDCKLYGGLNEGELVTVKESGDSPELIRVESSTGIKVAFFFHRYFVLSCLPLSELGPRELTPATNIF